MKSGRTIAVWVGLLAALFGCAAPARVTRRGGDLVPKQSAPGSPEVVVQSSADRAQLALRLAEELAEAGILVHLKEAPPASLSRAYVVQLGDAANAEVAGATGRVAIAPTAGEVDRRSLQPLLLIRAPGPAGVTDSPRPIWELRFDGLSAGAQLSVEEEHTLIEAVVLWIRNRAVD